MVDPDGAVVQGTSSSNRLNDYSVRNLAKKSGLTPRPQTMSWALHLDGKLVRHPWTLQVHQGRTTRKISCQHPSHSRNNRISPIGVEVLDVTVHV
jgi:hypothetical protein